MDGTLRVANWEKYQHYKDRRPPWIKFHVSLLDDYELMAMPPFVQLVYDRLLLLAAISENEIPDDANWIAERIHLPARRVQNAINVLAVSEHVASAPLALARSREAEAETQEQRNKPLGRNGRGEGTASGFKIPRGSEDAA